MNESWPTALGLTWHRYGDRLVGRFEPKPEHRGPPGFLHGGLAATCLDETMAGLGYMLDGGRTVTATLELRYRHPVPLDGRAIRIEAWRDAPPGDRRRAHRVHGELLLDDGTVAVQATGLFVRVTRR